MGVFCVFCTDGHVSACRFHQFYNLTKLGIEILHSFVYNVFIVVQCTRLQAEEGKSLPERRFDYHVHSQRDP